MSNNIKQQKGWIKFLIMILFFLLIMGFLNVYSKLIESNNVADILTLFTLPAVIGALIVGQYQKIAKGFILTTCILFFGFFMNYASAEKWVQFGSGILLLIGSGMLIYSLIDLFLELYATNKK